MALGGGGKEGHFYLVGLFPEYFYRSDESLHLWIYKYYRARIMLEQNKKFVMKKREAIWNSFVTAPVFFFVCHTLEYYNKIVKKKKKEGKKMGDLELVILFTTALAPNEF